MISSRPHHRPLNRISTKRVAMIKRQQAALHKAICYFAPSASHSIPLDLPVSLLRRLATALRAEAQRHPAMFSVISFPGGNFQGRHVAVEEVGENRCAAINHPPTRGEVIDRIESYLAYMGPKDKARVDGVKHGDVTGEPGNLKGKPGKGHVLASFDYGKNGFVHGADSAESAATGQQSTETAQ